MIKQNFFLKGLRLVGLLIFAFGGYLAYDFTQYVKKVELVTATIDKSVVTDSKKEMAQIVFYNRKNERNLFLMPMDELPNGKKIGDQFEYYFYKQEMDKSRIKYAWTPWEGLIVGSVGFILFLGGLIPAFVQRRRRKKARLN